MSPLFKTLWLCMILLCLSGVAAMAADAKKGSDKPLSADDMKMAREMNDVYARHMFNSACLMRQKNLFLPKVLDDKERAVRIKSFAKSCDCLADMAVKSTSPNDVIDFVTRNFGSRLPQPATDKKKSVATPKPARSQEFDKIGVILRSKETRKSCGLSQ